MLACDLLSVMKEFVLHHCPFLNELHVYISIPYFRQQRECPKHFENFAIPTSRQEIGIAGKSANVGFPLEFHMATRVIPGLWLCR